MDVVIANAEIISQYVDRKGGGRSNLPIGIVEDGDWGRVLDVNVTGVWRISTFSFPFVIQNSGIRDSCGRWKSL